MLAQENFLSKVFINGDVFTACLHHCLTTEKEEVVGLLIGEVDRKECTSHISAHIIMPRSDKQPDRVEIPPHKMCNATTYAEKLSDKLLRPMSVIGWYHSHPHITVWPSHVDLRTQLTYQKMDALFFGLIFAVYQKETGSSGNYARLTCFQAINAGPKPERVDVELQIVNTMMHKFNLEGIVRLPKTLRQEDRRDEIENVIIDKVKIQDELAFLHNDAFQTLAFVHIVTKVAMPLLEGLEARLQSTRARIKELERIKKALTN